MISADKPFDKKLRDAIKACAAAGATASGSEREKATKLVSALRGSSADEEFGNLVKQLNDFYLTRRRMSEIGQPLEYPIDGILKLGRYGFTETVVFAFEDNKEAFSDLPIDQLLQGGVPEKVLATIAKKRKELTAAALEYFSKNPAEADTSCAADWIFTAAKPKQLLPFVSLFTSKRERLLHLNPYPEIASAKLEKDKSGLLIKECLEAVSKGSLAAGDLQRLIVSKASLAILFIQLLPKLLTGAHGTSVLGILEGLLENLFSFTLDDRTKVSAALAVLGSQLLTQKKRKPEEEQAFTLLCSAVQEILKSPVEARQGLWVFVDVRAVEGKANDALSKVDISVQGAGFVVELLQEQLSDSKVRESVETLAFNLGIRPIGSLGAVTGFDPAFHEDTVGGLFRNDQVIILISGWSLGSHVLTRAKVKAANA
jgi:Holliday junction resolvase-like predicted endonuclease